ncbi:hypothetical protein H2200_013170 [Cladophialophora chaetospira]|uniref:Protein kinase domain-containing protein n=1 Tax=Cladophialophora chaetospira TaxID=386627 RepID=A0AA39CBI7_9EURO|nr:hypothetical protein H2200_013170 [Cladophialophora chaetospira]
MDPFSLTAGAASMADLCLKSGKFLVGKYRSYQCAEQDILELILRVEHHWLKTESQVKLLRSVRSDLGDQLQVHQNNVLRVLYIKVNETILLIDQVIGDNKDDGPSMQSILTKKGQYRKAKFALKIKECLHKTLDDLKTWQDMLDPSWFLMARIPSTVIDQQLAVSRPYSLSSATTIVGIRDELHTTNNEKTESIFVSADRLSAKRNLIPLSFSTMSNDQQTLDPVIVDSFLCNPLTDTAAVTKDIRNLARILSKIDPLVFGVLSCRGVIKYIDTDPAQSRFEFIFSIPPSLQNPASLRGILVHSRDDYSLNDRLDLAKRIASSVLFVHNAGFVHKNIRPETILVFAGKASPLQHPFLVGFEKFRPSESATYRIGDTRWDRNLYQHPKRQGLTVEEYFKMQHDIYSLGVCLLEIGLWTSFVMWDGDNNIPSPNAVLGVNDLLKLKDDRKRASEVKQILTRTAEERLPIRMGKKYAEIVVACLTCLDKGSSALGDETEFLDEDGIVVAVRYIERILMRIKEISI